MNRFEGRPVLTFASNVKSTVAMACLVAASAAQAVSIVNISSGPQAGPHDLSVITTPCCAGYADFALHDWSYVSPHVPDPSRGYVVFKFDAPVVVHGMTVIQHTNGLTRIEHLSGNSMDTLASEGSSWGNRGDVTGDAVFSEFEQDNFAFSGTQAGRLHKFVIEKTSLAWGYASYRWYLDFEAAPVPEPATWASLSAGLLAMGGIFLRRRTARASKGWQHQSP